MVYVSPTQTQLLLNYSFFALNMYVFIVVSTYTKGSHMVPILNALNVQCAVYGNHDFGKSTVIVAFLCNVFFFVYAM